MKVFVPAGGFDGLKSFQNKIAEETGLDLVFEDKSSDLKEFRVLLVNHLNMSKLGTYFSKLPNLELIQTLSAGVNMINFKDVPETVTICSNAGAYSIPVAEHAVAMGIALAKNLPEYDRQMKDGTFSQTGKALKLQGATALVVGYGGIGKHIGSLCSGLGMKVIGVGREKGSSGAHATIEELDQLLPESDIVFIATPLNKFTGNLFNTKRLERMKKNGILINIARAGIIDQKALYDHLKENTEFKAGIDTWWNEPRDGKRFDQDYPISALPNVLCSPHNSSMVEGIYEIALNKALGNIALYASGQRPHNIVKKDDYI